MTVSCFDEFRRMSIYLRERNVIYIVWWWNSFLLCLFLWIAI